jgi:hypothetical protein
MQMAMTTTQMGGGMGVEAQFVTVSYGTKVTL